MQIILNTDETLRFILLGLKAELGITPAEIYIGPVDGEIKTYAAVGEPVPNGVFDDDADDDTPDEVTEPKATDTEAKPRKKRVRRTKEQIAADEAKAKQQAAEAGEQSAAVEQTETKGPDTEQLETSTAEAQQVLETKPETAADQTPPFDPDPKTETATEDLFTNSGSDAVVDPLELETDPVVTTAAQDPFGDNVGEAVGPVSEDSLDLFSDPVASAEPTKSVTETEGGFVKPSGDDQVLDLFS